MIEGRKFIFRNIDEVIRELKALAHTMEAADHIFFVDTEFNVPDLRHGSELATAILREGLHERFHFITQLIPKPFDVAFARLLAEAGFSLIFSCESFSNRVLARNLIAYDERDIIEAMETCEQSSINCSVSLIFGLPGESHETLDHILSRMRHYPVGPLRNYEYTVGGRIYPGTPLCEYVEKNSLSKNLNGTKSQGYLSPYYFCAPVSPLEVHEYVKNIFPGILCYDKKYDEATHQRLAIGYLSDNGRWDEAVEHFTQSEAAVQAGIYDYLFKKLLDAKRQDDARAISSALLKNIEGGGGPPLIPGGPRS